MAMKVRKWRRFILLYTRFVCFRNNKFIGHIKGAVPNE